MNAPVTHDRPFARQSLPIEGMTCASCVRRVEQALAKVPGVRSASVNLATERADIVYEAEPATAAVVEAVRAIGYEIPGETVDVGIDGMTCASCVRRVEKAIAAVPGVTAVSVNLATERARVTTAGHVSPEAIDAAVRAAGYETRRPAPAAGGHEGQFGAKREETDTLRRDFLVAAALTLPLFVLEMGSHLSSDFHHWLFMNVGRQTLYGAYFVLATAVQFGPGLRFYRKGVPALLRLAPEMNALVVLGSTAAWSYSVVATFLPSALPEGTANVYFEASAVIVTLILLGRFLEARAKGRTSEAIKRLIGLQPNTATVGRDGAFVEIPLAEVRVGDLVQVRPGARIAVDGQVVSGSSYVDESMISGEPVPVAKAAGAEVVGGTINKTGSFVYRVTKVGADTVLAQIIRMVEAAQGSKLPIQALVDRVTAWFVPAVMAVALLTFLAWLAFGPEPTLTFALVNAVSVLIIACPCAMGLATPVSIMVGTGRAAEMGVLFRNGEALQTLRRVDTVALDKTGTLTEGRPRLTDLEPAEGFSRGEILSLVAAAESSSEHPVAAAIVAAAKEEGIPLLAVEAFEAVPGHGIRATVGGRRVLVGADRFLADAGIDVAPLAGAARRAGEAARTPLYAAVDGRLAALLSVADPLKPTTAAAIRSLHGLGLKVVMVTGDNRRTADAIARELDIDEVVAEVMPDEKVRAVRRLRGSGRAVAFVGDGINDAPALSEADVGVAIGTGTDIAIESADVVLMSGDLGAVTRAIALSKATIANIRQNLFWAFAYNVALIPVAAGALYPLWGTLLSPMLAAGAMSMSSVFVLANALRLRRFETGSR
ncbi:MAG TPA: copper-translocating P-type ATPase [Rhizobiales bacterium]|nr:copper-translocating P-type ATPase [Hyphomicrobiales bacterium]